LRALRKFEEEVFLPLSNVSQRRITEISEGVRAGEEEVKALNALADAESGYSEKTSKGPTAGVGRTVVEPGERPVCLLLARVR